jgi:hypothetical protein
MPTSSRLLVEQVAVELMPLLVAVLAAVALAVIERLLGRLVVGHLPKQH